MSGCTNRYAANTQRQAGYSLLETLAVIGIIGALMTFLTLFSGMNQNRIESTLHNTCKQMAQATLDNLRAVGYEKTTAEVNLTTGQINLAALKGTPPTIVANADLIGGPTSIPIKTGGVPFELNTYRSIVGTMTAIGGIYNSNAQFCSQPEGIAYAGGSHRLLSNDEDQNLRQVSSTVRIQVYNPTTGATSCPAAPIYMRPPGEDPPTALAGIVNRPANVFDDHGFLVTARTQYRDPSNQIRHCTMNAIFQYPRVRRPAELDQIQAYFNHTGGGTLCGTTSNLSVNIRVPAGFDLDRGFVLLCRDVSRYVATESGDPAAPGALCPGEPGAAANGMAQNGPWTECENVQICGQNRAGFSWNRGAELELTNTYTNIPSGCAPALEMRAIDPALNTNLSAVTRIGTPAPQYRGCNLSCPPGWTGPNFCAPVTYPEVCTPPPPDDPGDPSGPGGGSDGGGDGGGGADGGNGDGGGTDGANQ